MPPVPPQRALMARQRPRKKKQKQQQQQQEPKPKPKPTRSEGAAGLGRPVALLANLLIFGVLAYGWVLQANYPDFYYQTCQEDEYVEWATFWGFIAATAVFIAAAWRQRRSGERLPWFLFGVGLFCFFFAMEEISWGQRLLGYRPPDYFLAENFQQELNIHNVTSTALRKLTLKGIILGYGVGLAIFGMTRVGRRWLERLGVVAPPAALAPAFIGAFLLYDSYPWKFSGEWVELMLAFGFLFAGLVHEASFRPDPPGRRLLGAALVVGFVAVAAAGVVHAAVSRHQRDANPDVLAAATKELEALGQDFRSGKARSRCNVHRRLHTFVERYDQDYLLEGSFAGLVAQGLPESRARYLIDPWNTPYWIRDRCDDDRRVTFVYSFGPNRRRDSDRWEIGGDDVGVYIRGPE